MAPPGSSRQETPRTGSVWCSVGVAKQLSHANMQMVLTVYGKWIDGADKSNERGKIDSMFTATATKTPPKKNNAT